MVMAKTMSALWSKGMPIQPAKLPAKTIGSTLGIMDRSPYLTDLNKMMKNRVIIAKAMKNDWAIPAEI
jgi:hypothetical protein